MNEGLSTIPQKVLSVKEASRLFGLTEYFLRRGIKAGTVPYIQNGTKFYICTEGLSELLKYGAIQR